VKSGDSGNKRSVPSLKEIEEAIVRLFFILPTRGEFTSGPLRDFIRLARGEESLKNPGEGKERPPAKDEKETAGGADAEEARKDLDEFLRGLGISPENPPEWLTPEVKNLLLSGIQEAIKEMQEEGPHTMGKEQKVSIEQAKRDTEEMLAKTPIYIDDAFRKPTPNEEKILEEAEKESSNLTGDKGTKKDTTQYSKHGYELPILDFADIEWILVEDRHKIIENAIAAEKSSPSLEHGIPKKKKKQYTEWFQNERIHNEIKKLPLIPPPSSKQMLQGALSDLVAKRVLSYEGRGKYALLKPRADMSLWPMGIEAYCANETGAIEALQEIQEFLEFLSLETIYDDVLELSKREDKSITHLFDAFSHGSLTESKFLRGLLSYIYDLYELTVQKENYFVKFSSKDRFEVKVSVSPQWRRSVDATSDSLVNIVKKRRRGQ